MNVPVEVALGDGDPPRWITVHVRTGTDYKTLTRRCALLLGVDPEEFTKIYRADRHNSPPGRSDESVFMQPLAKFLLVRKSLERPCPLTVLACGDDSRGQLGRRASPTLFHDARPVPGLLGRRVASIAAGSSHTAFVLESGVLLTCGDGSLGRLGFGEAFAKERDVVQSVPRRVEFPVRCSIVQVQCSGARTYCVTVKGEVFVFGEKGACLGLGQDGVQDHIFSPRQILGIPSMRRISASESRVLAIAGDGKSIWGWGVEDSGNVSSPRRLEWLVPSEGVEVVEVAAGHGINHYSLIALSDGSYGEISPDTYVVRIIPGLQNSGGAVYNSIGCGCNLSIVLSNAGEAMCIAAQTSFIDHSNTRRKMTLRHGSIRQVLAGKNHVVFVSAEGRPFGFGESSCGQLTVRNSNVPEPIWLGNGLDCVETAAVGDGHTLLLYSSYVSPMVASEVDGDSILTTESHPRSLLQQTRETCVGVGAETCVLS